MKTITFKMKKFIIAIGLISLCLPTEAQDANTAAALNGIQAAINIGNCQRMIQNSDAGGDYLCSKRYLSHPRVRYLPDGDITILLPNKMQRYAPVKINPDDAVEENRSHPEKDYSNPHVFYLPNGVVRIGRQEYTPVKPDYSNHFIDKNGNPIKQKWDK
jgi:hypothetical protein